MKNGSTSKGPKCYENRGWGASAFGAMTNSPRPENYPCLPWYGQGEINKPGDGRCDYSWYSQSVDYEDPLNVGCLEHDTRLQIKNADKQSECKCDKMLSFRAGHVRNSAESNSNWAAWQIELSMERKNNNKGFWSGTWKC